MNVYEVRRMLQHKPITDIPLRVVSYCRVSTKSAEQATSIENQVEHYRKKIQSIPAWTFVSEYVDNGISGTSVKARVQFNRMVEDAQTGKFDLIVTKAVSRFARNTLGSLMFSRKLLEVGVGVWFDTDGILNLDKDGELRLSIVRMLREEHSRSTCLFSRPAYALPLMERSACSMRRLPMLTGRRFNFNREDAKGRIKSKVAYHVQIKLISN